jgi:hypothetical protein
VSVSTLVSELKYYIDSAVVTVVCTPYVVFQIEWHWWQHLQVTHECITTTRTVTIRGTQVGAVVLSTDILADPQYKLISHLSFQQKYTNIIGGEDYH